MALTERYVTSGGTGSWADATNPATPAPWATMLTGAVAGDVCNIFGSFTLAASSVMTSSGTSTSPIILRGRGGTPAAPTAAFLGRTNGNGPMITTDMPAISYNATFRLTVGSFTILESLNIASSVAAVTITTSFDSAIVRCNIANADTTSAGGIVAANAGRVILFDNDLIISSPHASAIAVNCGNAITKLIANRIKGGVGVTTSSGNPFLVGNVIYGCSGNAVTTTAASGSLTMVGNTIVGAAGTGILLVTSSTALQFWSGNMITDSGAYGVNWVTAQGCGINGYNRFRDNTSGNINLGTDWNAATGYANVTTDSGGPETDYQDSGANDYRIISASPAKATGWLPYTDIGALQREEAGGGGGAARRWVQNL